MKSKILSYSNNNLIHLRTVPNSSKNEFVFDNENKKKIMQIKVKIKAPPKDGKANAELIKFFRKKGIKIEIVKGLKSRDKIIRIL